MPVQSIFLRHDFFVGEVDRGGSRSGRPEWAPGVAVDEMAVEVAAEVATCSHQLTLTLEAPLLVLLVIN